MKSPFFKHIFLLIFISVGFWQQASAQFKIGATIRPRSEYRNGFKTLPTDETKPAFFTEQRSRINMDYSSPKYSVGFALQDIRIWGSVPQINKTDGFTSVHEAWAEYKFTSRFSAKLGRQELDYDDARILGNLDWAAQARSHDAVKLVYQDSTWTLHAGAAFNQDNRTAEGAKLFNTFYDPAINNYKHLHYLWFKKSWAHADVSLLALNNGLQAADSTVHFTQTMGGNLSLYNQAFKLDGTGYYQAGRDRNNKVVKAYLLSMALSYVQKKNATFTLGADVLSGSGQQEGINRTFDPLYGTHHKFYGLMDYFYVGNAHRQPGNALNTGLVDLFVKTSLKPTEKLALNTHLHRFSSPVQITNPNENQPAMNAYLGTEIDLFFTYTLSKEVNIQGGYSQMLASPAMEVIKGGSRKELSNWAWLMVTFKPTLFTTAK
jgi:hypothetical protein